MESLIVRISSRMKVILASNFELGLDGAMVVIACLISPMLESTLESDEVLESPLEPSGFKPLGALFVGTAVALVGMADSKDVRKELGWF